MMIWYFLFVRDVSVIIWIFKYLLYEVYKNDGGYIIIFFSICLLVFIGVGEIVK